MKANVEKTEGPQSPVRRRIVRAKEVTQSVNTATESGIRGVTNRGNNARGKPRFETNRNRSAVEGLAAENGRAEAPASLRPATSGGNRRGSLLPSRPVTVATRPKAPAVGEAKVSASSRKPVSVVRGHAKVSEVESRAPKNRVSRELAPHATLRRVTGVSKATDNAAASSSVIGSRRQPPNLTAKKVHAAKAIPPKRTGPEKLNLQAEKTRNPQKTVPQKDTLEEKVADGVDSISGEPNSIQDASTEADSAGKLLESELEQDENKCANNGPISIAESDANTGLGSESTLLKTGNTEPAHADTTEPEGVVEQADDGEKPEAKSEKNVTRSTRRTRSRRVSPDVNPCSESFNERVTTRSVRRQRRGAASKKVEHADMEPECCELAEQQSSPLQNDKQTPCESQPQPKKAPGRRKGKVAASTVAQENTDVPSSGVFEPLTESVVPESVVPESVVPETVLTPHSLGDKRTDRIEPTDTLVGSNVSEDQGVQSNVRSLEYATEPAETEKGIDKSKVNPPSANGSKRPSLIDYFTSFFTESSEKENPLTTANTASEIVSPDTSVLAASGGNRRDSVASNCSSCSLGERTIDTTGLVDTKPYYSLNPAMLNDRNLWKDQNLRKLCKILRISSAGGYDDILDRLNYWNRDYEALTQLLERKKNKKVDLDESSREQKSYIADRQHLAVCNFHSLALGKQHILPMYLRPLKRLPRKLRHKPILSSSARPNDHLHFTPRPVKKNKPKPALVFSPYNQVVTFNLRKEERQEKRKRIYEIAQSVDCMDNPIADLEGDERWVEARRNLFENCFRVRQCTEDEHDLHNDDAFDPLYFRSADNTGNPDLLSWFPNEKCEDHSSLQCLASSTELGSSVFEGSPLNSEKNTARCDAGTPPRQHSQPAPGDDAAAVQQQRRAVASMLVPTPPRGRPRTGVAGLLEQSQSSSEESSGSGDNYDPAGSFAGTVSV